MAATDRLFAFLPVNARQPKPHTRGVTEIRGPYDSPSGKRYLQDLLETMGDHIDSLKFAGGSLTLMPRRALEERIELCHRHDVLAPTGRFSERVLATSPGAVDRYPGECRALGPYSAQAALPHGASAPRIARRERSGVTASDRP